jgi:hypothetical protein
VSVTRVNTPAIARTTSSPTSSTVTWGSYTPVAGDLLVACVSADGSTSVTATAQNAGTSGWTKVLEVFNSTGGTGHALVAVWTKTAAGSDAWPQFTSTLSGTASMTITMVALRGASGAVDTSGTFSSSGSGTSTATVTSEPVTTSGSVSAAGEYALAIVTRERAASTYTFTASGTGFTALASDGAISDVGKTGVAENSSPGSGAALTGGGSWSGTGTSAYGAGALVVFAALVAVISLDTATGADAAARVQVLAADSASGTEAGSGVISAADSARARDAAYSFGGDWCLAAESASVAAGSPPALVLVRAPPPLPAVLAAVLPAGRSKVLAGPAGPVAVTGADTAHAAEAGSVPGSPSGSDSGHGADAGSVHAALSGSDSGSAAEGSPVRVSLPGADSGHGSDTQAPSARVASADTGHGTEAGSVHVSLSSPDSGHGAEAGLAVLQAALPLPVTRAPYKPLPQLAVASQVLAVQQAQAGAAGSDACSAAEAGSVHASLAGADTGHAAEVPVIRVSGADSAHGAEHAQLAAAGADAAHGAEQSPVIRLSAADAGHGTGLGQVPGSPSGADAGHGTEAGGVHASLAGADSAHGTEGSDVRAAGTDSGHGLEGGLILVASADSGHGLEGGYLGVSAGDTPNAQESQKITAGVLAGDSAIGSEAGKITASLAGADAGHAAEHGSSPQGQQAVSSADHSAVTESVFYYILSSDAASAADLPHRLGVRSSEFPVTADIPRNSWPASRDPARAADRAASAWLAGDDTARAAEGHRPFRFALADSAHGLEVLHEMGIWTYIPVNVRLSGKFWRITGTDEHGNEVTVLEGERLTGQALELAERVSWSRVVRRVSSGDSASAGEAVAREPVAVTCWAQPAVPVSVSATAAAAATAARG